MSEKAHVVKWKQDAKGRHIPALIYTTARQRMKMSDGSVKEFTVKLYRKYTGS